VLRFSKASLKTLVTKYQGPGRSISIVYHKTLIVNLTNILLVSQPRSATVLVFRVELNYTQYKL